MFSYLHIFVINNCSVFASFIYALSCTKTKNKVSIKVKSFLQLPFHESVYMSHQISFNFIGHKKTLCGCPPV